MKLNSVEAEEEEKLRAQKNGSAASLPDFRDPAEVESRSGNSKAEGSVEQIQETPIDEGDTAGAYFSIFMYYIQVEQIML